MMLSSTYLLRPTIWLPRADVDCLRAAEAHRTTDIHCRVAPAADSPASASHSSGPECGMPRRAAAVDCVGE